MDQIEEATDDTVLRSVCLEAVDTTMEARYTRPIATVTIEDKNSIVQIIKLHFVLVRSKAVLDQLMCGLTCMGVVQAIQGNPMTFRPFLWLMHKQS